MKKYLLINAVALAMIGCGGGGSNDTPSSVAASVAASSIAASVAPSSAAASSIAPATWSLVWSDEFDGANLDTTKWSYEKNCWGGGNNEMQCYTDRAENSYLADGSLHIVAKKETFNGPAIQDDQTGYNAGDMTGTKPYTSARLRSKSKGDWTYGRMEIRAMLPQGQGIWPAIWMLPTELKYGGWPSSGEIDIMEAVNTNTPTFGNEVHGTLHFGTPWHYEGTSYSPPTNIWEAFHTYTIEWEAGTIRWYVDNKHFATQTSKGWYTNGSTSDTAPFDEKFHLLLNLAVGGDWPKGPNDATVFPQHFMIDYVRVYQCAANPVTGKGCASHVDPAIVPLPGAPKVADGTLAGSFDIFTNAVDPVWNEGILTWDNGSAVIKTEVIDSDEAARGKVISIKYGATSGVAYIQSKTIKDASVFATGGNLQFDVKVTNYGTAAGLIVKADCVNPCSSGDIAIGKVANGVWETITVPVATLVSGGLNLARLNTPFVIFPTWGAQAGVELQVDNVRWVK